MLATSVFYFMAAGIDPAIMAEKVLTNLYSAFIIIAVPLFVFTAKVMNTSKVSDMIYGFAHAMVEGARRFWPRQRDRLTHLFGHDRARQWPTHRAWAFSK